ncbi:amino acid ABC transporter membrane protein (PAAT family) [Humitalea rosea]|uniref:Amino acid ABC transporter membrane protein (PAAT family) n=1 Tax=Humitalea rosea TaxID=990373 RepID=A0A2W7IIC0_9PROT|nr:amino acid ABC transporter permease [Humitalea rosea]PZW46625.1 amino acid ABC transporter membrane protein (PAAT family) [Humitalea rosea]
MKRYALAVMLLLLAGCGAGNGGGGGWAWYVVDPTDARGATNLGFLLSGFTATIPLSLAAMGLSLVLGFLISMAGFSRARPLRWLNRGWVEVFRAVPILVMLLWAYYGLPVVLDLRLSVFTAAVLAIALCDSAFEAEILRAGIQSVELGQREAAQALGLSRWHIMRFIVLPQAIRRVLPPIANQFIYVVKMSSLASVIGFPDLTRKANELVVTVFRPLELYSVLILEYLVLILAISFAVRALERRMGADQRLGGER